MLVTYATSLVICNNMHSILKHRLYVWTSVSFGHSICKLWNIIRRMLSLLQPFPLHAALLWQKQVLLELYIYRDLYTKSFAARWTEVGNKQEWEMVKHLLVHSAPSLSNNLEGPDTHMLSFSCNPFFPSQTFHLDTHSKCVSTPLSYKARPQSDDTSSYWLLYNISFIT